MSIFKDMKKVEDMMVRVYNGKMIEADKEKNIMGDAEAIKALCQATFGDGSSNPDPTTLHNFNNVVTKVADIIAQPDLNKMISYFANITNVPANTQLFEYKRPHPIGLKFKWTAIGSDVALKRVEQGQVDYIKISQIQTGISYNPLTTREECVENFKALVNDVASAKVRMVYETIMAMIQKAVTGGSDIPATQIKDKTNVTFADFSSVANIIARRTGARPIFVADRVLIDYMANLIGAQASTILVDSIKDDMYNYELTNLRVADAVPMINDFTSIKGVETQFPINRGYILGAGGNSKKAFEVVLAGGLLQHTENEFIEGRVKMIIRQGLGIDLLAGEALGFFSVIN